MSNLCRFKFKNPAHLLSMDFGRQAGIIEWGLRLFLGCTFIFASWHKIVSPDQFATILYGYAVFPHPFINVIAIVMPFVELVCGITLVTGLLKRSGLLLINAMLVITSYSIHYTKLYEFPPPGSGLPGRLKISPCLY